jgi:hypothetical protein
VSFAAVTLCVSSQRMFIVVISSLTQSGNFWIHTRNEHTLIKLQAEIRALKKCYVVKLLPEQSALEKTFGFISLPDGKMSPKLRDSGLFYDSSEKRTS